MQDLGKDAQRIICTAAADRRGRPGRALRPPRAHRRRACRRHGASRRRPGRCEPWASPGIAAAQSLADLVEAMDPASVAVWTADRSRHGDIARALPPGDPTVTVVTGDAPKAAVVIAFDLPTAGSPAAAPCRGRGGAAGAARHRVLRGAAGVDPRGRSGCRALVDAIGAAAAARRATIVRSIEEQRPEAALLTLAPLFERYDAAAVAAALYQLWTSSARRGAARRPRPRRTAKIYVGIGKKDGATVNDLVAVLTKDIRVDREKIGRVELRDAYSLVELPAQEVERVASALNGVTIRRKRITARVDRGPTKPGGTQVAQRFRLTSSFKALAARNAGTIEALIARAFPVLGLRPSRAARRRCSKLPNPEMATLPPRLNSEAMIPPWEKNRSVISPARARVTPSRLATASTTSCLFTGAPWWPEGHEYRRPDDGAARWVEVARERMHLA